MSDTLPSNRPSLGYEVEHSLCNSHGCRQFTEELYQYPEEIAQVLTWYGTIWQQDEAVEYSASLSLPINTNRIFRRIFGKTSKMEQMVT